MDSAELDNLIRKTLKDDDITMMDALKEAVSSLTFAVAFICKKGLFKEYLATLKEEK